jgi:UPF0716 protein FxsA
VFLIVLIFILVPLTELWLLIRLGNIIGAGSTVALVVATGIAGAWLTRKEGLRTFALYIKSTKAGDFPGDIIFQGVSVFIGGLLLMTPGLMTDLVGLSFLLEPTRAHWKKVGLDWIKKSQTRHVRQSQHSAQHQNNPDIYDQNLDD